MCAWCRRRTEEALNLELEVQVIVSQLLCDGLGFSLGRSEPPTALSSPKLLEATVYRNQMKALGLGRWPVCHKGRAPEFRSHRTHTSAGWVWWVVCNSASEDRARRDPWRSCLSGSGLVGEFD